MMIDLSTILRASSDEFPTNDSYIFYRVPPAHSRTGYPRITIGQYDEITSTIYTVDRTFPFSPDSVWGYLDEFAELIEAANSEVQDA